MYVVPKKANDMMNVGMLECYTVRELFHFLYAFFMKNVGSLKHSTTFCSDTIFFLDVFSQGKIQALGTLIMQVNFRTCHTSIVYSPTSLIL